ncbi:hypothetical protein QUA74_10835 [Microcoleus sp. LAD1_D3]|uniref:hypothetical protein n=1 Tax=Microcoleus sp. LAD1_D3 TaxID=2819365 RepID=UPI002FD0361C
MFLQPPQLPQNQKPAVQQQPQVESIVYKPSAQLKHLKNVNNWQFLVVNFAIGIGIANLFRFSKAHLFLGIVVIVISSLSLFFMLPGDRSYLGLWRTGGAALGIGGILCFWDLYYLLTWQHGVAIAIFIIVAMWIIGAGSK